MESVIRAARERDYDDVERIMKQVHNLHVNWRPDTYKDVETVLPYELFLEHIKKEEILVAENENGIITGVLIYVTRHASGGPMVDRKVLFIDSMAVDEKYRGQGIGHKFFDYMKSVFKTNNYDSLELQVNAKNLPAIKMYEEYGFTQRSINMELL